LIGEDAELVALGLVQVGGVGFFEEKEEVKDVVVRKIQVDDARASAFAPARQSHACFAKTTTSDEKVALLRIPQHLILESSEVLVANTLGELSGEKRRLDEEQNH
jgi:hypothetical protein